MSKRSSSAQARSAAGAPIVDDFGSIGLIPVVDYLGRTPSTATTKLRFNDEMLSCPPPSHKELQERLDLGRSKVPFETARIFADQDPLRAPGEREPWQAHLTNLNAAHEEHYRQDRANSVTFPSRSIFDEGSWTHRQMIERSSPQRIKHLREWEKRDNATTGRYPAPQLPREVPEHYAVDALLMYDRSKMHRKVAVPTKTKSRDDATRQAQLKMRCLLQNFISESPEEHGEVAATFPERARFDFHAKIDTENPYVESDNVGPAEEFDILDFSGPDELEYAFDAPNAAVGAYDRDEVDYYVDRKIEKALTAKRKIGFSDNHINDLLASNSGCTEQELEERIEESKARLVQKKKLLPPPVSSGRQSPAKVHVVTVKQVPAKRASPSESPSSRSHDSTEAESMSELVGGEAGQPSPESSEASGQSSRSGRALKKPRRYE